MKGIAFHDVEDVRVEEFPDPEIKKPDDAIVKVERSSICGSDLHVYFGKEKGLDAGTILGHEFVGEIVDVGNSSPFKKGQRVMSPFTTNCGKCYYCKLGLTSRCEKGNLYGWVEDHHGLEGGQAEYIRVPLSASTLVEIPEELSWEQGLFLGDIFSTGFFCADQVEIKPEGVYVVLGCGPVGLMTLIAAKLLGASTVFAVDSIEERLQRAKKLGGLPIALSENLKEKILNATNGRGADGVMESVGSRLAGESAYEILRPGGIISSIGVCTDKQFYFSPTQAYDKNVTFKSGRCPARFYMEKLIPILMENDIPLESIISHNMKLKDGKRAYEIFANKEDGCMKVILHSS